MTTSGSDELEGAIHQYKHLFLPASLITAGAALFFASTWIWWRVMRHQWSQIWNRNGGPAVDRLIQIVTVTPDGIETIVRIYFVDTPVDAAVSSVLILAGAGLLVHERWLA